MLVQSHIVRLATTDAAPERSNHVFFVVREAAPRSALLFQTSDATWQAYNAWGDAADREHSLYRGPFGARGTKATRVS